MAEEAEELRSLFYQAGWNESRRVDTTAWEKLLKDNGYSVLPAAVDFLSRFGNLDIPLPDYDHLYKRVKFRIGLQAETFSRPKIKELVDRSAKMAGTFLCPISSRNGMLLMDKDGLIYGVADNALWKLDTDEMGSSRRELVFDPKAFWDNVAEKLF